MEKSEFFADARNDLTGPLAGVRVIEATTTWAGPMAGCLLADYGADVIKIEHPDGEVIRRLPPLIPNSTNTIPNETVNRNKRNLSLDLRADGKAPTFLGDDTSGMHGAKGAMAALKHRDQTGEGQHVDIALVDSLFFQSDGFPTAGALGVDIPRWGNQFGIAAPVNAYPCSDGQVFAGVLLDTHWRVLAELMGVDELSGLDLAARLEKREELDAILAQWCASRTVAEVVEEFAELGLPACKVNSYADAAKDSHIHSRDLLQNVEVDGEQIPLVAPPANFSRTPLKIRSRAPGIGQHNREILSELGYDEDAITRLVSEGAVGAPLKK